MTTCISSGLNVPNPIVTKTDRTYGTRSTAPWLWAEAMIRYHETPEDAERQLEALRRGEEVLTPLWSFRVEGE